MRPAFVGIAGLSGSIVTTESSRFGRDWRADPRMNAAIRRAGCDGRGNPTGTAPRCPSWVGCRTAPARAKISPAAPRMDTEARSPKETPGKSHDCPESFLRVPRPNRDQASRSCGRSIDLHCRARIVSIAGWCPTGRQSDSRPTRVRRVDLPWRCRRADLLSGPRRPGSDDDS